MSSQGYEFLTEVFQRFDKDKDGALSPSELKSFTTQSQILELPKGFITDSNGYITLQGFMAFWSMITFLDASTTFKCCAVFGFWLKDDLTNCVKIYKRRDRKRNYRGVFQCWVVGAIGSGKTSILNSFINKQEGLYACTRSMYNVVNSVEISGSEKYLIMQELSQEDLPLLETPCCDVVLYVYDSTDVNSFTYIQNLRNQYPNNLPSVFVATKSDGEFVVQKTNVEEYCHDKGKVAVVSVKKSEFGDLFGILVEAAVDGGVKKPVDRTAAIAGSAVVCVLVAFLVYRLLK